MAKIKRILHVVGGMNRGGAETWLLSVLRHVDRQRFEMDFLVHTAQPCAYDEEIRALGSQIIPCLHPSRPLAYGRNFRRILREYGPYDIVHSHVHYYSGYVLRLAHHACIPVRIAHSHIDTSGLRASARWWRRAYWSLMGAWINKHVTIGLAASQEAAADLFGQTWNRDPRWCVLYCGIDLSPFYAEIDREMVRSQLGIPTNAFTVGHVGRFDEQKNHESLIDIAVEIANREPGAYFLLVGDGELRQAIERKIEQVGLSHRFILTGIRSDVPRLMMGAMDVLLLPSLYEGLPIVGLEAQAAGLPIVVSDTVTPELTVANDLTRWLSLSQPYSEWAQAVLESRDRWHLKCQRDFLTIVENSAFNIRASAKRLEAVYDGS